MGRNVHVTLVLAAAALLLVACELAFPTRAIQEEDGGSPGDATLMDTAATDAAMHDGSADSSPDEGPADGGQACGDAAAPTDAGGTDADLGCLVEVDACGACNNVPQLGTIIAPVWSPAPAPSPMGGVIADGIYVLEQVNVYGQCPSGLLPVASTMYICGNTWQQSGVSNGAPSAGTIYASFPGGSKVTITATCGPMAGMLTLPEEFTVSGQTLFVYFGTGTFEIENIYTKVQ